MPRLLLMALLLAPQDELRTWLDRLASDHPAARDEAAEKRVGGYATWRPALDRAPPEATDAALQARRRGVLAEGEFRAHRERFRASLPERVRRQYPDFADALFSKNPERRLAAVQALGQIYAPVEKGPFAKLFLSPNEARRSLPEVGA